MDYMILVPNDYGEEQAVQEVVAVCSKLPCCCSLFSVIPCCTLLLQVFLQACLLEYLLWDVSLRGQSSKYNGKQITCHGAKLLPGIA